MLSFPDTFHLRCRAAAQVFNPGTRDGFRSVQVPTGCLFGFRLRFVHRPEATFQKRLHPALKMPDSLGLRTCDVRRRGLANQPSAPIQDACRG